MHLLSAQNALLCRRSEMFAVTANIFGKSERNLYNITLATGNLM